MQSFWRAVTPKFAVLGSFLALIACDAVLGQQKVAAPRASEGQKNLYITVRIRPDVSESTLDYLSGVTRKRSVAVEPDSSLDELLHKYYGLVTDELEDVLRKNNPTAFEGDAIREDVEHIALPPGPNVGVNVIVSAPNKLTTRQLAQVQLGNNGSKTQEAIENANPGLKGKWDSIVAQRIDLPYVTNYVSFPLRTKSLVEAEQIARKLKQLDNAVIFAGVDSTTNIVPSWKLSAAVAADCSLSGQETTGIDGLPSKWDTLDSGTLYPATVAVIDTGISDIARPFHFWHNPSPGQRGAENPSETQCINDQIGCNLVALDSPPLDDCVDKSDFHHGTHIAGIASGRLSSAAKEIDKRIQLMVLKITNSQCGMSPGNVADAIKYAYPRNANVVNLSLTGSASSSISDAIKLAPGVLFLAAAGNPASGIGINLDDPQNTPSTGFPANLTKILPDNVISVAAIDSTSKKLACFSNYGSESVDIAAPGVNITSTISASKKQALNGTSQATAVVSLLAGILYSQGLTTPPSIKHRILASSDYNPNLQNKTSIEGTVNFAKALQFNQDLVQFSTDLHLEAGELISPTKVSVVSENNGIPIRGHVYKIVFNYSTDPQKKIRITVLRNGHLVNLYSNHTEQIRFKTSSGAIKNLSPNDLVDITLRQMSAPTD